MLLQRFGSTVCVISDYRRSAIRSVAEAHTGVQPSLRGLNYERNAMSGRLQRVVSAARMDPRSLLTRRVHQEHCDDPVPLTPNGSTPSFRLIALITPSRTTSTPGLRTKMPLPPHQ